MTRPRKSAPPPPRASGAGPAPFQNAAPRRPTETTHATIRPLRLGRLIGYECADETLIVEFDNGAQAFDRATVRALAYVFRDFGLCGNGR